MPCIMAEPAKPPKMARKSKAPAKMFEKTPGMFSMFITMTTRATKM